ncbi:MAG: CoA transferase, partial [Chloroflexi bacterium]|nr:CoA transferase [Chloroflexota bacterium]
KVMTVEEAVQSPQVRERELLTEVDDRVLGKVMVQSRPVKFSHGVAAPTVSAPLLGEHTRPVLRDLLGLSDARIQELLGDGVLQVDDRVLPLVMGEEA